MSNAGRRADFERFFLASPDLMCTTGADGCFLLVNPAFTELLGWDSTELVGLPFLDFVHPDDLERTRQEWTNQLAGERLIDSDNRYRTKDGTYRRIQWRESGLEDGVIYSVGRDVTRRHEAEVALSESEAKARSVLETAMIGILTLDARGVIEEVNPAAERLFGWRAAEVVGQHVRLLLPLMFEPLLARPPASRPQVETSGGAVVGTLRETEGRRKDGSSFPLELAVSEFSVGGRRLITGIVRDLSVRAQALREVEEARAQAEAANAEKSAFLSRMSHELRTPLNAILGFAQLLEMESLTVEQIESVNMIMTAGRHLLGLINEVLDISRIEAGQLTLSLEPTHLIEVVAETTAIVTPLAHERGVHFDVDVDERLYVRADGRRLNQVLLNLLTNAVKYGPRDAAVSIVATKSAQRVRLAVADHGPGIAPDSLRRLFTPFERLEATMGEVEGTGLGLALSKRLTEAMEGEIGVESTLGVGTTFFVELASARAPRAGSARDETAATTPGGARARGTVLYIEDQLSNQVLVRRVLARRPGVRLLSATYGQMGLKMAREYRPDLVLLDLDLPDVPGGSLLVELKSDPATRDAPVVIVSADRSAKEHSRLREEGAAAIMIKPIDVTELLTTVDRLLADEALP